VGQLVGFTVTLGGFKVDCLKFFLKAKIISYAQRVEKISLCETDSPDTGEVALAPEGERCPEGAEGEDLAIARNISGSRTVLTPHRLRAEPPHRGGQGVNAPFSTVCATAVAYLCLLFYTPGVRHRKWQNEKGF